MDIYKYLIMDHERVSHWFKLFNDSTIDERKKQIADLIAQELLLHAESEQETFYKKLERHATTKEEGLHGEKEHKEIEDQINKISREKPNSAAWTKGVNKLQDLVEHHVKEEEGPIFKKAKKIFSLEEAYRIKEEMHYLKESMRLKIQKRQLALSK